jgi:hypothetical protein
MDKIIDSIIISDYEVLTDTGFENVKAIHKTKPYEIYNIKTKSHIIKCSHNHILFSNDYEEVFAEDILLGEYIHTDNGLEEIISIVMSDKKENMYDLELFEGNRRYFTDGILSHNTHVGKTSNMIALGANFLKSEQNVLYITLEMSEEKIAQRFDANYLGVDINDVPMMKEKSFKSKLAQIKEQVSGKLIIKEYPPASIGVNKIRFLLEELKIKQDFEPKIIIVDYLNLLVSDRITNDSLYSMGKAIAEELRGLAVDKKLCMLTATQGNREMNSETNSDADFTNVSESKAVTDTADTVCAMIMPAELREQNIQIWKILKNRYGGIVNHKIPLRVNFSRATLSPGDYEMGLQGNTTANGQAMRDEQVRSTKRNKIVVKIDDNEKNDLLGLLDK